MQLDGLMNSASQPLFPGCRQPELENGLPELGATISRQQDLDYCLNINCATLQDPSF